MRRGARCEGRGPDVDGELIGAKTCGLMQMMAANELDVDEFRMIKLGLEGQLAASEAPPLALPNVDCVRESWPTMTVEAKCLVYLAVIERLEIGPATLGLRSVDTERISWSTTARCQSAPRRAASSARPFPGPRRIAARAPRPVQ